MAYSNANKGATAQFQQIVKKTAQQRARDKYYNKTRESQLLKMRSYYEAHKAETLTRLKADYTNGTKELKRRKYEPTKTENEAFRAYRRLFVWPKVEPKKTICGVDISSISLIPLGIY